MRPHRVALAAVLLCNILPSAALPQARRALTADDYARAERALGPATGRLVSGIPGRPIWLPDGRAAYRVSTLTGGQFVMVDPRRRDRKSTRLNSSHRTISYAVFCLKKKKKKSSD